MARVTFIAEGLQTFDQLQDAIAVAAEAGFPGNSEVSSPTSSIVGARVAFTTSLHLLPTSEGGDE